MVFCLSVTHFFFISGAVLDTYEISLILPEDRNIVEADSFWCMSKLLDGIQDNYTFAQPGIQTKVSQLRELTQRIDGKILLAFFPLIFLEYLFRSKSSSTTRAS